MGGHCENCRYFRRGVIYFRWISIPDDYGHCRASRNFAQRKPEDGCKKWRLNVYKDIKQIA